MMTTYKGDVKGDVIVRKGDDVSKLTSVGGWLDISAEGAQLPVLTSVGGWLDISAEGAQLPVLTSVGGGLDIRAEGAQLPVLQKVKGHDLPDAETARQRLIEVAKHALVPGALYMEGWHNKSNGCGTAHCIAGWAVHLAREEGYALEAEVSQPAAGNILLGAEASALFYLNNDEARSALHKVLAEAGEKAPS
ncbi:MAG TPA: hypothetical protein VFW19_10775 [Allosphingosinicella sp.]|nr:hypothetical protein [Allosphingosinicella sp.]